MWGSTLEKLTKTSAQTVAASILSVSFCFTSVNSFHLFNSKQPHKLFSIIFSQEFTTQWLVTRHTREVHLGVESFQWTECDKVFNLKILQPYISYATLHFLITHNSVSFFKRKSSLESHFKTAHTNEKGPSHPNQSG